MYKAPKATCQPATLKPSIKLRHTISGRDPLKGNM